MYIYYSSAGRILCCVAAASDTVAPPSNPGTPLYLDDATYADVWAHPSRYLIVSGVPVEQPYLTLTVATDNSTTPPTLKLSATLNNPPQTPPADVTFTVAGSTQTVALASGAASLEVQVDANLAGASAPLTASATGCVGASLDLGTAGGIAAPLQAIAPGATGNASTTAWRIATSSVDYALGAAASMVNQTRQLNAMAVSLGVLTHIVAKMATQANEASYAALGLTADETNALSDLTTNVLPAIAFHLGNIYPSGGSPAAVYAQWKADMAAIQTAMQDAETALSSTPHLS